LRYCQIILVYIRFIRGKSIAEKGYKTDTAAIIERVGLKTKKKTISGEKSKFVQKVLQEKSLGYIQSCHVWAKDFLSFLRRIG
jgi:hypothetical protein